MKKIIKKIKKTNLFSTGDMIIIEKMKDEGQNKCIHLWIRSKALPLINSKYAENILLGHKLNDLANSVL